MSEPLEAGNVCGQDGNHRGCTIASLDTPASTLVVADCNTGLTTGWTPSSDPNDPLHRYIISRVAYPNIPPGCWGNTATCGATQVDVGDYRSDTNVNYPVFDQQTRHAGARALLEPAVRANPDDPHLAVELALTYLQSHDFQRCEQNLLKIRRDHPAEPDLWNPLVDLYMKRTLFPKAIEVLQDSLKLRPGDTALSDSLADAFFESGDVSGAQSNWQSIAAVSPNDVQAHYGLAECFRKNGKTVEAVSELETVMRLDPGYKESMVMLGQLYLRAGRAAEGGKLLREYQEEQSQSREYARVSLLLASRSHDSSAHFEMARHYAASGKPERAVVELHRALELNPKLDDARKMLAGLDNTDRPIRAGR